MRRKKTVASQNPSFPPRRFVVDRRSFFAPLHPRLSHMDPWSEDLEAACVALYESGDPAAIASAQKTLGALETHPDAIARARLLLASSSVSIHMLQ